MQDSSRSIRHELPMADLSVLLHRTFGFPAFRANQEAVCRAATDGQDVLLVMPTGAGKSLCYQLPAIARGGTALVISPLIALMDDQAAKLSAAGLSVARIHSGLSRDDARQACRQYLDGTLQFLFIAPERMRVPGFPEMLARKKPSLIAIDEAHCISAWGHDFRPDYRTLGDHLPALRPSPIIALTATATPTVQQDIVAQLNLHHPSLFIHGFRRDNLAIEVVEMSKPRRAEFTVKLLADKANRPAIVYAPSRKAAEELASQLGRGAAPYHAGLDPATRDRVQTQFLAGNLEVVVATIAFGMGIDKADVRTVVHVALPGSVEAFYQEIGRAGRDGLPSRTILLHSYADRKMHDFFLERDYPPPTELSRVAALLTDDYQMPDLLRQRLKMDIESFDNAAQKLASQGAAVIDIEGNVRGTGSKTWRQSYDTQVAFRRSQIDRMAAFAESQACRMTSLIRHFGDTADGTRPCGHCDICAPNAADFRPHTTEELRQLAAILRALDGQSRSTGKLHTELAAGALRNTPAAKDRKNFDALLDALARAALITLTQDTFTNPEGNAISYKKAALTHEGREAATVGNLEPYDLQIRDTRPQPTKSRDRSTRASGTNPRALGTNPRSLRAADRTEEEQAEHRRLEKQRVANRAELTAAYTPKQKDLANRLRTWRKEQADANGTPAFYVLTDAILIKVVMACPVSLSQLLKVSGIGQEKSDRYGAAICAICRDEPGSLKENGTPVSPPRISPTQRNPASITPDKSTPPPQAVVSSNRQQDFRDDLIVWRKTWGDRAHIEPYLVVDDMQLEEILLREPRTIPALQRILGLSPTTTPKFLISLLEVCTATYAPEPEPVKNPTPPQTPGPRLIHAANEPSVTFTRPTNPQPETPLTPTQQALDTRLREWRKSESARRCQPQFFVLSSSTLRSIVLIHPTTLDQLQTITGMGSERTEKFGPAILEVCLAPALA